MIRTICAKRARKLRKRGEYVWWDRNFNSFCWVFDKDRRETYLMLSA